jgi:hypothetical protein
MNMEGLGMFSRQPKDYLKVSTTNKVYFGSQPFTSLTNTTNDVVISFQSDFITTKQLPYPKGFLLYFSSKFSFSFGFQDSVLTVSSI